jgi:hypothetical protein
MDIQDPVVIKGAIIWNDGTPVYPEAARELEQKVTIRRARGDTVGEPQVIASAQVPFYRNYESLGTRLRKAILGSKRTTAHGTPVDRGLSRGIDRALGRHR